jgi:Rho-binding antiterminator
MTDSYDPIDCSLHDRIEEAATLGRIVKIVYDAEDGVVEIEDRITDWFARDGAEFLQTAGGISVRLDRIRTLDGVAFRS